jgi:hypothetical protein
MASQRPELGSKRGTARFNQRERMPFCWKGRQLRRPLERVSDVPHLGLYPPKVALCNALSTLRHRELSNDGAIRSRLRREQELMVG